MPTIRPVTRKNVSPANASHDCNLLMHDQMNYVTVLMAATMLFAVIYWYASGRYYYTGPRVKAQLIIGTERGGDSSSSDEKRIIVDEPAKSTK